MLDTNALEPVSEFSIVKFFFYEIVQNSAFRLLQVWFVFETSLS